MEMDSIKEDVSDACNSEGTSVSQSLTPDSTKENDIFGDQQVFPRVGNEYQVALPYLITEAERIQLLKNPPDSEVTVNIAHSFVLGLPVPLMWIHNEVENHKPDVKRLVKSETSLGRQRSLSNEKKHKADRPDSASSCLNGLGGSEGDEHKGIGHQTVTGISMAQHGEANLEEDYNGRAYSPVPGSPGSSWSDVEKESFLLGLYIFGKNLIQVQRFVESKDMGDILSFYYGGFYRSAGYIRWSECRKARSRKCIHGQKIFTGWRQQEMLSRVLPQVSETCRTTLLEASKSFGEGKLLLEEYVSTLKATIGISAFIEAVGIGKGKKDLTGIHMEPTRTNQVSHSRSEIPVGKACSSLTSGDIVKFLTGGFRLSKARSNDIFWEAVWPRLLARGWRSEQPKNCGPNSKNPLVFIIPGIKKFSRRKLVKGNQYFDCVTDVLNKVASDPELLEFETEAPKDSSDNIENGWGGTKITLDKGGHSDHQNQSYLKPLVPKSHPDLFKFTIVDTSLGNEEEPLKVRELKSLPVETANSSPPTSLSSGNDKDSSEEPVDEPDAADKLSDDQNQGDSSTSSPTRCLLDQVVQSDLSDCNISDLKQEMINDGHDTNASSANHQDPFAGITDISPRKMIKCQFSRRAKPGQSKYLSPIIKRRRLSACGIAEAGCSTNSFSVNPGLVKENSYVGSPTASENMVSAESPSQEKISTSSSAKGSPDSSAKGSPDSSAKGSPDDTSEGINSVQPSGSTAPRDLIDLNLPHVPSEFDNNEQLITELTVSQDIPIAKKPSSYNETYHQPVDFYFQKNQPVDFQTLSASMDGISAEQEPAAHTRRQGTRNRPLTTKALEALACGFLTTKRKRRGRGAMLERNKIPRPSKRGRRKVASKEHMVESANSILDSMVEE